jgi:hypothetical protein
MALLQLVADVNKKDAEAFERLKHGFDANGEYTVLRTCDTLEGFQLCFDDCPSDIKQRWANSGFGLEYFLLSAEVVIGANTIFHITGQQIAMHSTSKSVGHLLTLPFPSIPLVALQYHQVRIKVLTRPIDYTCRATVNEFVNVGCPSVIAVLISQYALPSYMAKCELISFQRYLDHPKREQLVRERYSFKYHFYEHLNRNRMDRELTTKFDLLSIEQKPSVLVQIAVLFPNETTLHPFTKMQIWLNGHARELYADGPEDWLYSDKLFWHEALTTVPVYTCTLAQPNNLEPNSSLNLKRFDSANLVIHWSSSASSSTPIIVSLKCISLFLAQDGVGGNRV